MTTNTRPFAFWFRTLQLPVAMLGLCLAVVACSGPPETAGSADAPGAAPAAENAADHPNATEIAMAKRRAKPHACELLTADEMSQILGKPVTATQTDPFNNQTVCTYTVEGTESDVPRTGATMQIEWGTGKAAAKAMGIMTHTEVGAATSDAELGDGAQQIGPTLMIVVGEHDVTIISNNVGDPRVLAKHMLEIAGPRIRKVGSQN